jgi:hypothetical protein
MSTTSSQIMKKKFLLPLGALIVGSSAIFGFSSQVLAKDVKAGPIFSNDQAKTICPGVCNTLGAQWKWNGQWRTTVQGKASVCGCVKN